MNPRLRIVLPLLAAATAVPAGEPALRETLRALETLPAPVPAEQTHGRLGFYGLPAEPARIEIDLGREVVPDEVVLFPARLPTGAAAGDGSNGFPTALSVAISGEASFERSVRLARWAENSPGEGNRRPFLRLSGNGASGRHLAVTVEGFRSRESGRGRFFALGEIVVLERGANVALGRPVVASASTENPPRWRAENLTDGYLWCLPFAGRAVSPGNGYHSAIERTLTDQPKWVEIDLGDDFAIDEVHLVPAHPRDFADVGGFGFPPRFRVLGRSGAGEETTVFVSGPEPFPNPGAAVMLPGPARPVRQLRIEATALWQRTGDYIFALAELRAIAGGENRAAGAPVSAADTTTTGSWRPPALVDGHSSRHELLGWVEWLDALDEREALLARAEILSASLAAAAERARRRWLLGAGGAVLAFALAAALLVASQRRRAAREQEALKSRLAADLHDEIGASLSHLALQGDLARRRVAPGDPVAERLAALSNGARETLDHLRDTVWLLSPVAGTWGDLETRLAGIAARLLDGVGHEFVTEGERPTGSPSIGGAREIVLFLKEALTNVQKHASASAVVVKLIWDAGGLTLTITDDGTGFDPAVPKSGRGLRNLEARAKTLRGTCRLDSAPGKGTTISLTIPQGAGPSPAPDRERP